MKRFLGNLLAVTLLSGICYGDDYDDAGLAYDKKDYKKAFKLYSKSCDSGDEGGCAMIGAYYEDGIAVSRNLNKALEYYDKACGMGENWSCEKLPTLKAKMPVCSESEISFINDKRYFEVTSAEVYPLISADSKTIQIDKKNKTIKVWTVWIASESKREDYRNRYGGNYNNFGYVKYLDTINYGSMKSKSNAATEYTCTGSSIYSNNSSGEWSDIVPNSVMEMITNSIIKKYNLK